MREIKRIVVFECRYYNNYSEARDFIDKCTVDIKEKYRLVFVSGTCQGADLLGERYASENNCNIERFPAEWKKYGFAAGPIRNRAMADRGDYFICFWDGVSSGTKSMIDLVSKQRKPLRIKHI